MGDLVWKAMRQEKRRRRLRRRQKLFQILQHILNGDIDSSKIPLSKLFSQKPPRLEYISPRDRGGFNYRYMEADEILAGTPFED